MTNKEISIKTFATLATIARKKKNNKKMATMQQIVANSSMAAGDRGLRKDEVIKGLNNLIKYRYVRYYDFNGQRYFGVTKLGISRWEAGRAASAISLPGEVERLVEQIHAGADEAEEKIKQQTLLEGVS